MTKKSAVSNQVRVRRGHKLASYKKSQAFDILDAGYIAHTAFIYDGYPVNIPMIYWRDGDYIYWHGSTKSRAMLAIAGDRVCLTVTHFDGLVFAKSAFHHSANYRSLMIFGIAEAIGELEKPEHLFHLMERIAPGRNKHLRPMQDKELKATSLLRMPIERFSIKTRSGPPVEDPDDLNWSVWTGTIPFEQRLGQPESALETKIHTEVPEYLSKLYI